MTKDYTPYAMKREAKINKVCNSNKVKFHLIEDYCLNNPGTVLTSGGTAYQKYTPYYRSALKVDPPKIQLLKQIKKRLKLKSNYTFKQAHSLYTFNTEINVNGGNQRFKTVRFKDQKDYAS